MKLLQLTKRLMFDSTTNRILDLKGHHVATVDLKKNEVTYNNDAPDILKAELGVWLMKMEK